MSKCHIDRNHMSYFLFQVANPDVVGATKDADILIFVLPHQFVRQTCKIMQEYVKDTALAISLIKVTTVQPLYDTPCYNMVLDITPSCCDAQNVLTMEFYKGVIWL